MKKLIALILCLMLCVPAFAMAETAEPAWYDIDFGPFSMLLKDTDAYQVAGETPADGQVFAQIVPDYDPTALMPDNINFVWSSGDDTDLIRLTGPEAYAEAILSNILQNLQTYGIKVMESAVLGANHDGNLVTITTYVKLDYTGAGIDVVTEQYQTQVYYCFGEKGTWIVTLTSTTTDGLLGLCDYLVMLNFAN